jgi:hypothetical protein
MLERVNESGGGGLRHNARVMVHCAGGGGCGGSATLKCGGIILGDIVLSLSPRVIRVATAKSTARIYRDFTRFHF